MEKSQDKPECLQRLDFWPLLTLHSWKNRGKNSDSLIVEAKAKDNYKKMPCMDGNYKEYVDEQNKKNTKRISLSDYIHWFLCCVLLYYSISPSVKLSRAK